MNDLKYLVRDNSTGDQIKITKLSEINAIIASSIAFTGRAGPVGAPGPVGAQGNMGYGIFQVTNPNANTMVAADSTGTVAVGDSVKMNIASNNTIRGNRTVSIASLDGTGNGAVGSSDISSRQTSFTSMQKNGNVISSSSTSSSGIYSSIISSENCYNNGYNTTIVASNYSRIFSSYFSSNDRGRGFIGCCNNIRYNLASSLGRNSLMTSNYCRMTNATAFSCSIISSSDSYINGRTSSIIGSANSSIPSGTNFFRRSIINSNNCFISYGLISCIMASTNSQIDGNRAFSVIATTSSGIFGNASSTAAGAVVIGGNNLQSPQNDEERTTTENLVCNSFTPSDIRIKKDIEPYVGDDADTHLSKVKNLKTKTFRIKSIPDPDQMLKHGFIAQELEAVFPYTISDKIRAQYPLKWNEEVDGPTGSTGMEYWIPENTGITLDVNDDIVIDPNDLKKAYAFRTEDEPYKLIDGAHMKHLLFYTYQKMIEKCKLQQEEINLLELSILDYQDRVNNIIGSTGA